jgi:hypothetical protein
MKHKLYFTAWWLLILTTINPASAQVVFDPPVKKLIDFGWHSPFVQEYKDHLALYESGPFDGVGIKLSEEAGNGNVFMVDDWGKVDKSARDHERDLVSSLKASSILTDNFVVLYGASQMDWFSDGDWARVEDQLRFAVQMARAAHCKGVFWDPEPYKPGKNPWNYVEQEKHMQYSFEQYNKQVRKRGAQFMKTLQEEFPGIIIFSLRELSDWQIGSPFSTPLLPVTDKEKTFKELEGAWWGLHFAFYAGMLDAIEPGVQLIDGNEEAYYYTSALDFYRIRQVLVDDAKALVPPELWSKHSSFFKISHSISVDYIAGNWLGMTPFPYRLTGQGLMMTGEERAEWFEHNAYYAMRTADEYAWLYTEDLNWWTGEKVPDGFREALIRAKKKVAAGQSLGFEIEPMIKKAQDKAEEFYKNK